jgi:RNA polymerase sigma-70 factor (ECF subfamily)
MVYFWLSPKIQDDTKQAMKLKDFQDISDEMLLEKYQDNQDQKILAALFNRYRHLLFGVCLKYFKNEEEAKDACMDIYVKCVDKLKKHRVEKFRPWLFVTTKNHCLEKLRKAQTHRLNEKTLSDMYSEPLLHPDNMEGEQVMIKLDNCIEQLSDEQARVIKAFYYKKLRYQDIATVEKLPWNTVRSHIQNARRKLKICLETT